MKLGGTEHAFARKTSLVERALLGDVGNLGTGFDAHHVRRREQVLGKGALRRAAKAAPAAARHQRDADVPTATPGRWAVMDCMPAHQTNRFVADLCHQHPAVVADKAVSFELSTYVA